MYDYLKDGLKINVKDVTLLSKDEVLEVGKHIKKSNPLEPYGFYLRTPGNDSTIAIGCLGENGSVFDDYVEPDYLAEWNISDESGAVLAQVFGIGLKPIIHIESDVVSKGIFLKDEDKVKLGNETFTYVTNNILILDHYISGEYDFYYHIFDNSTNDYDNSEAKVIVDAWFKQKIKPYL